MTDAVDAFATPIAAVLRVWGAVIKAVGSEVEPGVRDLKITPQESCRVASVEVWLPAANEPTRRLASEVAWMPCLTGD